MHCPNCGSESPSAQKFCRSCGFDLKPVSQLFTGTDEVPDDDKWRKTLTKWVVGGFLVIVAVALALLFSPPGVIGIGLGSSELAIILIILAMILAVPAVILLLLGWKPGKKLLPPQTQKFPEQWPGAQPGKTTDKLLFEPAASITEDTTRQLEEAQRQDES